MYSLEFAEVTTLIVTLAGAATAITSLAQTLVGFVCSRRTGDARAGAPTIVINNTSFIVTGDTDDDADVLVSYLRDHEVREIVIVPAPSKQDPQ